MRNEEAGQDVPAAQDGEEALEWMTLADLLTWLGEGKYLIASVTVLVAIIALVIANLLTPIYTARTTLLTPGSQQQSGSATALAALGSLGSLAGGLGGRTPDELYVALLKSDSVVRALDARFALKARYRLDNFEALRRMLPSVVRTSSDKKSGVISLEADDRDPQFAADLVNGHVLELSRLLARLAVTEAQQRRVFFEEQLKDTGENLSKAEMALRGVQERSGLIALDKQSESLIASAARIRALIAEREVRLKVLRTGATEQNPDVMRLTSELQALRYELSRVESNRVSNPGSATDMPVGKIPEASIDYVRARREVKIQETLLEAMVRQFELAKLDEAKEGPLLQQIDKAVPPDHKSKPSRVTIVVVSALFALFVSSAWVIIRRLVPREQQRNPEMLNVWRTVRQAWRLR
jgi:uncharacterized protein involved in exopolysaccharide biosynthesis